MASLSKKTENRRRIRQRKAGRRRKNREGKRSTVNQQQLFAGAGEPGKPAKKSS